jgi:hypothetical protein
MDVIELDSKRKKRDELEEDFELRACGWYVRKQTPEDIEKNKEWAASEIGMKIQEEIILWKAKHF